MYLSIDVLHLVDVWETLRDACNQNYYLDPSEFYASPGLARQAALKSTSVSLNLFTENELYFMIERVIRAGVAMIIN